MGSVGSDIFGGGRTEGFEDEQKVLQEGLKRGIGFEKPFMQFGQTALGKLLAEISGDPTQTITKAEGAFTQSPSQKFQQSQALEAIRNAQAAGGTAGSGLQQQQLTQSIADVTGGQQQQFVQDVLGGRQQDIGALSGVGGIGQQAAATAAGGEFGLAGPMAQAAGGADVSRAGRLNELLGSLFGGLKSGISYGAGGGGFAGGLGAGLSALLGGL